MQVTLVADIKELEGLSVPWRRMVKGHPFLGPDWLLTWWRHLGSVNRTETRGPQLAALAVTDSEEKLVALAPWYLEHTLLHGRTLRFLGSGDVCSDYLSIACRSGDRVEAVEAIADWLIRHQGRSDTNGWDLLSLEAIDLSDRLNQDFIEAVDSRGAITSTRSAGNCWRIELPKTWDEYVAGLSKTNRKRARRLDRNYLQTGRAVLNRVTTPEELKEGFRILVELHTKRWQARGAAGVFADPGVFDFHHEVTQHLMAHGHLRLSWLEIDGQPAAAEYCVTDGSVVYSYQSGLDPELISHEPGVLMLVATLQDIIECGFTGLDFLRGDEPYKLDWLAERRPIHDVRVVPGNWPGHLRQSLWQAATGAKDLLRAGRKAVLSTR